VDGIDDVDGGIGDDGGCWDCGGCFATPPKSSSGVKYALAVRDKSGPSKEVSSETPNRASRSDSISLI